MRYLKGAEILLYIHAGKEIELFLGEFYHEGFKCFRYVSLGKNKDGYYGLVFEKYDDSDKGLKSVYDFSSVEPDDLYGKEIGPFNSLEKVLESINSIEKTDSSKYLIAGQINEEIKAKFGNS